MNCMLLIISYFIAKQCFSLSQKSNLKGEPKSYLQVLTC